MTAAEQIPGNPSGGTDLDSVDRQLIAALAAGRGREAAAATAGVSVSTVHRRGKNPRFQAALADAKAVTFSLPAAAAVAALPRCVARLVQLVEDYDIPPSSVVRAAEALIDAAVKLSAHADILSRLAALEAREAERAADAATAVRTAADSLAAYHAETAALIARNKAEADAYFATHPDQDPDRNPAAEPVA